MKILLDTNFLIDLIRFKIDMDDIPSLFLEKCEFFTLNSVINELGAIAKTKSKESMYAKITLKLLKDKKVKILKTEGKADESILNLPEDFLIATNDAKLRKMLKAKGTKTIYIKSRKHLGIG